MLPQDFFFEKEFLNFFCHDKFEIDFLAREMENGGDSEPIFSKVLPILAVKGDGGWDLVLALSEHH